jgi:hypothetical protein
MNRTSGPLPPGARITVTDVSMVPAGAGTDGRTGRRVLSASKLMAGYFLGK